MEIHRDPDVARGMRHDVAAVVVVAASWTLQVPQPPRGSPPLHTVPTSLSKNDIFPRVSSSSPSLLS